MFDEETTKLLEWQNSPIAFIRDIWFLEPQPLKPEYEEKARLAISVGIWKNVKAYMFQPFIRGKHLTWQQWLILLAVERAIRGEGPKFISVASGHGTGKSTTEAWLMLWFLLCFEDSQIPCTSPTTEQMFDILWKEVAKQLRLMPEEYQAQYEWQSDHVRMILKPETWFARAKTGKKENPEALAGMHAEHMLYLVDESSGVAQEVFNTAEGALTGDNFIFLMISNPTRTSGYFYDSHHDDAENWQLLVFDSEESPIVNNAYVERIRGKHGEDSDEFRFRVKGTFPRVDSIDKTGYMALLNRPEVHFTFDEEFTGGKRMGIDPAGQGSDEAKWVIRDAFKARVVGTEKNSTPESIVKRTLMLAALYKIPAQECYLDLFGVGGTCVQKFSRANFYLNTVSVGDRPPTEEGQTLYLNRRAEASWKFKQWLRTGGELVNEKDWDDIFTVKYTRNERNLIQMMSKMKMIKEGFRSPNTFDAVMLTFMEDTPMQTIKTTEEIEDEREPDTAGNWEDKFSI